MRAALLVMVALAMAGCGGGGINYRTLGPASTQVGIEGYSSRQVHELWGFDHSTRRSAFLPLQYGLPAKLPTFNEQWNYARAGVQRMVYLNNDTVVLAVEERLP